MRRPFIFDYAQLGLRAGRCNYPYRWPLRFNLCRYGWQWRNGL